MLLQEIKDQLPNASPADVVNLTIEFDRTLQKLCEFDVEYVHFYDEYASDINYLRATRQPENRDELIYFVDTVIGIGERLANAADIS